jgi:transcriptional regulator with XRE-family HTH domain
MPQINRSNVRIARERRAFGKALRSFRTANHLTQEQLAFASDLSPVYISILETGRSSASIHTVLAISRGLQVKPDTLFHATAMNLARIHNKRMAEGEAHRIRADVKTLRFRQS